MQDAQIMMARMSAFANLDTLVMVGIAQSLMSALYHHVMPVQTARIQMVHMNAHVSKVILVMAGIVQVIIQGLQCTSLLHIAL